MTIDIKTDRNWRTVAEDLFTEGAWPTLSVPAYDTWPTSVFATTQRIRGTLVFGGKTSSSGFPLIAYAYDGGSPSRYTACQLFIKDLKVKVKIACRGMSDVDNSNVPAEMVAHTLWGKLQEAMDKQTSHSALTQGSCGFASSATFPTSSLGTGGQITQCYPITVPEPTVRRSTEEERVINRFSKDVWVATGTVTFTIYHN